MFDLTSNKIHTNTNTNAQIQQEFLHFAFDHRRSILQVYILIVRPQSNTNLKEREKIPRYQINHKTKGDTFA